MKLVVNADDFGLTSGVNRGIIEAYQKGIVTSASLMAGAPAFEEAVSLAHCNPGLGIGCHLMAIGGRPVLEVPASSALVVRDGRFPATLQAFLRLHPGCLFSGWQTKGELVQEFLRQVDRVRRAGLQVSHLDTHKHLHALPGIREAVFQVALERGIPFVRFPFEPRAGLWPLRPAGERVPLGPWRRRATLSAMRLFWANDFRRRLATAGLRSADATFGIAHTGALDIEVIGKFLRQQYNLIEICCHPGYYDSPTEPPGETLRQRREKEVAILTDPAWGARLAGADVRLTNYLELARA